jgi:hypothetical protein
MMTAMNCRSLQEDHEDEVHQHLDLTMNHCCIDNRLDPLEPILRMGLLSCCRKCRILNEGDDHPDRAVIEKL